MHSGGCHCGRVRFEVIAPKHLRCQTATVPILGPRFTEAKAGGLVTPGRLENC